ncbi:MAG: BatD family protein [Treponema sp.]|nr:BatD family protein [Treponema sp.]
MDRSCPRLRAGLLARTLLIAALLGSALAETEALSPDGESLTVEIRTSPEIPLLNTPWKVLILVDYPEIGAVKIQPPDFPASLDLERVFTGGRVVPGPGGGSRQWTAVEYSLIPRQPGPLNLGPFEIRAAGKRALTQPLAFFVRGAGEEPGKRRPFFRWETPASPLSLGESGEFALIITGWDPRKPLPQGTLLRQKIPADLILEEEALSGSDRERGVLVRFRLFPLKPGDIEVDPSFFYLEGFPEIPALRLRVRAEPGRAAETGTGWDPPALPGGEAPPALPQRPPIAFPPGAPPSFPLFSREYERVRQNARELWEGGERAAALAVLRRGERDLSCGPALVPLRREAERVLALETGPDERWRPLVPLGILWIGTFFLLLLALKPSIFSRGKDVTSPRIRRYKGRVLCLTVILSAGLFCGGEAIIRRSGAGKRFGIVRAASILRRVPDPAGGAAAPISEGRRVVIRGASDSWVYAEVPDGRAGWIPAGLIIFY